jgi:hypothetical protein
MVQQHQQHGDPTQIINPMFSHKPLFSGGKSTQNAGMCFHFAENNNLRGSLVSARICVKELIKVV